MKLGIGGKSFKDVNMNQFKLIWICAGQYLFLFEYISRFFAIIIEAEHIIQF